MKTHYTLLTGASQGLGKSLALELAKHQENIIMVSLPDSGQEALSDFIIQNFNVKVHHIELDLSNTSNYKKIADYVTKNNLQIKYLINNAGILSRGSFETLSSDFILKQIEVNVIAPTLLTKLFK